MGTEVHAVGQEVVDLVAGVGLAAQSFRQKPTEHRTSFAVQG
jgi:hypothetical protein